MTQPPFESAFEPEPKLRVIVLRHGLSALVIPASMPVVEENDLRERLGLPPRTSPRRVRPRRRTPTGAPR